MDNLTISKDKVLEAAKTCPEAEKTLKVLFPDVFKPQPLEVPYVNGDTIIFPVGHPLRHVLQVRMGGKGLYLNTDYRCEVVTDNNGLQVLTFYKK